VASVLWHRGFIRRPARDRKRALPGADVRELVQCEGALHPTLTEESQE
jgi:hypothetical protein